MLQIKFLSNQKTYKKNKIGRDDCVCDYGIENNSADYLQDVNHVTTTMHSMYRL